MSNVTKLHLVLILVFVFSLSGLAIEILYLLQCRRRRRRRRLRRSSLAVADVDPELQGDSGVESGLLSSKWTLLLTLCFKKQPSSRVEPASATPSPTAKPAAVAAVAERETVEAEADEEDYDLTLWRETCLGPSRVLYTIKEEEEEGVDAAAAGEDEEARHGYDSDGGGTPFYTPASSPLRTPDGSEYPIVEEIIPRAGEPR